MKTLRPYQDAALKALWQYIFNGTGHPLVVAPVGAGKSLLIAEFIRQCHEIYPRTRIVMITHVKELLMQNREELDIQYLGCDVGFYCAGLKQKDLHNDVTFASIQSIHNKIVDFNRPPEVIIVDECFTGDTIISTNKGMTRIDKVRLGDIVYNAIGFGEVLAISKKSSNIIYKVRLSNGQEIRCTRNHPFLSEQGWTAAKALEEGSRVFSIQNMPELWETLSSLDIKSNESRKDGRYNSTEVLFPKAKVLLNILLKEDGECHVGSGSKREDVKKTKRDRAQTICSWWKWQRNYWSTSENSGNTWDRMGGGSSNTDKSPKKNETISNLLQSGHWPQWKETGDRVGRQLTLRKEEVIGREERQFSDVIRVESVEIEEQRGGEFVYNLQVSGHPSYFANGVLVHNCHLIPHKSDTRYRRFINAAMNANPNVKVIGFTGTPFRADSGRLEQGNNALFDDIAYEIDMPFMIEEGYWSKPVSCSNTKMDTQGVAVRGGDFVAGQLEAHVNTAEINDACVKDIIEKGKDRRKWLVFTVGVQHCTDVLAEFERAGISAEMVTGETPAKERDDIILRFRQGKIKCLVNVAVLTTGFNVPDVDLLALMRPTQSPVLYIQTVGRGVRPVYANGFDLSTKAGRLSAIAAGPKKDVLVLDYGGVIDRLGPIDQVTINKIDREKEEGEGDGRGPGIKFCPMCTAAASAAQRYCYECGYQYFELAQFSSEKAVVSMDNEPETHKVIGMNCYVHKKKDADENAPRTMKVIYSTMAGAFTDYVCFEHTGYAREKACKWYAINADTVCPDMVPTNVEDAIKMKYRQPSSITVRKEGQFWRIKDKAFDENALPEDEDFDIPY